MKLPACLFVPFALLTANPALAAAADADHGRLPLDQLSLLLGDAPPASMQPRNPRVRGVTELRWYTDTALGRPAQRAAAAAAFSAGHPVAVLRGTVNALGDTRLRTLFSVASSASMAIYQRRAADGATHVLSVDLADNDPRVQRRLARQLRGLMLPRLPAGRMAQANPDAASISVPTIAFVETRLANSGNGSLVALTGTLTRSTGPSFNVLAMTLKTRHVMRPHDNGMRQPFLVVPGNYTLSHEVGLPTGSAPPRLHAWEPRADPRTEIEVAQTTTSRTSYGSGFSLDATKGLQNQVRNFAAKKALSFDFSREHSITNSLAFKLKDYSLRDGASAQPGNAVRSQWEMPLADFIVSDRNYFGNPATPQRMTPTMRQNSPEVMSEWLIPGQFDGAVAVTVQGGVRNREILGGIGSVEVADTQPQATITLSVDASSLFLTPEPTVFIQSKAGNGGCLRDVDGQVRLASCPDVSREGWQRETGSQWQLDMQGRYINRGSRRCLQLLTSGAHAYGQLITRPCTTDRDQRWEWFADRIHSLHGDGKRQWRLFVGAAGVLNGRTNEDPARQVLPVNGFHPLLNPWSSYPARPASNDFIPKLENLGQNQPIPPEYRQLAEVDFAERWELIVLRQSLMR